jgi:hypothetical protein
MNKINLNEINWCDIQNKLNKKELFWSEIPKRIGFSRKVLERAVSEGYLKKIVYRKKMSVESKNKISKGRIKYLKENPDKHPWKNNDKFKSKPCELLKMKLDKNNIKYISEYEPSNEKYYSIDIAFPNKKIGIEINGNQHYERDGSLKNYYIKRNEFLNNIGWKIYDIHYSIVYNELLLESLINSIRDFSLNQDDLNYYLNEYIKRKNVKHNHCIDCNIIILKDSKRCRRCAAKLKTKVTHPTKEELKELIKHNNWSKIGRIYNVSDTAIRKWARGYELI